MRVSLIGFVAAAMLAGCTDEPLDPFDDPDRYPCVPTVNGPAPAMLLEGMPATFELSLAEPYSCGISAGLAVWDFSGASAHGAPVTVEPRGLQLDPAHPTASVTLLATPDDDTIDGRFVLEAYIAGTIGGESPAWGVLVIDGEPDPM